MAELCGRPTRRGTPCRSAQAPAGWSSAPACLVHLTAAELEELKQVRLRWEDDIRRAGMSRGAKPACWAWPVTDADRALVDDAANGFDPMYEWQQGRCAVCGDDRGRRRLVLDHDHDTGWCRGWLCPQCNLREPGASDALYRRYRRWNPARILGMWERYHNVVRGYDYGRLGGLAFQPPHPVSPDGVVQIETGLRYSAANRVGELLVAGLARQQALVPTE